MVKTSSDYWFKRRRYGWGWVPTTRWGWVIIVLFLLFVLLAASQLPPKSEQATTQELLRFIGFLLLATSVLTAICAAKGPVPHWRWGNKPTDNPNEDY